MKSRAVFLDRIILGELAPRGRRLHIADQVRGHIEPRILEHWRRSGWRVHQVGQAAYVHGPTLHLIFGVWGRRDPAPVWAGRLGHESAGYLRRVERCAREQTGRRFLRDAGGRFRALLPWWRTPGPRLYRWLAPSPSFFELERGYR
jgi:hypothetical protein